MFSLCTGCLKKRSFYGLLAPKTNKKLFILMGVVKVFFCSKTTPFSRNKHRKIRKFYIYKLYCLQLTTCYMLQIKAQNDRLQHLSTSVLTL